MPTKLKVVRSFTIPLAEVSGICLRRRPGGVELVAVGDDAHALVTAPVGGADILGPAERRDVRALFPGARRGSQWEAVAADASGHLFLLEEAGQLHVLSPGLDARRCTIAIDLRAHADLAREWDASENSRGEGLVLLRGGRVLLVKEKRPPRLIELGPAGAAAAGVAADHLEPDAFPLSDGPPPALTPLQTWSFDGVELGDVSDVAVGPGGALYLVSDEDRCLLQIDPGLPAAGGRARILGRWDLPKKVKKPEGLVILDDGSPLVAADHDEDEPSLFLLERPG
jgi:hypothetical protein